MRVPPRREDEGDGADRDAAAIGGRGDNVGRGQEVLPRRAQDCAGKHLFQIDSLFCYTVLSMSKRLLEYCTDNQRNHQSLFK